MEKQILELRSQGKTYNEIAAQLGCSKSTVSYYAGKGQKEKAKERLSRRRKENVFIQRTQFFRGREAKSLRHKADDFQREREKSKSGKRNIVFDYKDVIDKFGSNPSCYLTGRALDLSKARECHFDHIMPVSRGGDNSLENLGIACKAANQAKGDLTVGEFLQLCVDVLTHHGCEVLRKGKPIGDGTSLEMRRG